MILTTQFVLLYFTASVKFIGNLIVAFLNLFYYDYKSLKNFGDYDGADKVINDSKFLLLFTSYAPY